MVACGTNEAANETQTSQSPNLLLSPLLNSDSTNKIQNQTANSKIWTGTAAEYAALGSKDADTLYFVI